MLVLSRKLEQEIVIGDDIAIKVIKISSGKVWLGITAPIYVSVDRLEVREDQERKEGKQ